MIDCKSIVQKRKEILKKYVKDNNLEKSKLYIIQVGNISASNAYVKNKLKDCEEVGICGKLIKFDNPDETKTEDVILAINIASMDENCKGVIVQLPLPKHINVQAVTNAIPIQYDVDGFKEGSKFTACTPMGVITILDEIGYDVKNKEVCIIGQSNLVGRPLVELLLNRHCTVVSCNSKTKNLNEKILSADVVVSAAGCHGIINSKNVRRDQIIIDVGINFIDGKQYGDCSTDVYDIVQNVTPRIGGTGLFTRLSLLENVIYY